MDCLIYKDEEELKEVVERHFESVFQKPKDLKSSGTQVRPQKISVDSVSSVSSVLSHGTEMFFVTYKLVNEKRIIPGEDDVNHGEATFVYWFHRQSGSNSAEASSDRPSAHEPEFKRPKLDDLIFIEDIPMYCSNVLKFVSVARR